MRKIISTLKTGWAPINPGPHGKFHYFDEQGDSLCRRWWGVFIKDREAKRIVASAVRGHKSIAVEASKTLANLKMTGKNGQWARQHLGFRVSCPAEVSSITVREVWTPYSSIECRRCGCRDKRNRSGVSLLRQVRLRRAR